MLKKLSDGMVLSILLCLVPVGIWLLQGELASRLLTYEGVLHSMAEVSGLVGMVLFSLSLILSARTKLIEWLFGGLNKVYKAHARFGKVSYLLLLAHPIFIVLPMTETSVVDAITFIFPGRIWTAQLGTAAFAGLTFLIYLTVMTRMRYDRWHLTHKFMGVVYMLAAVHTFYAPSDVRYNSVMKAYFIILVGVAVGCYFYRTILGRYLVKKYLYVVKSCRQVAKEILEIQLIAKGKAMNFSSGQFLFLEFKGKGLPHEAHPFTIDSAPPGDELVLTIKSLGDYTSHLSCVVPGTIAYVEGPYGNFTSKTFHKGASQIWIAGGIGVAPFISLVQNIGKENMQVDLYYSVHSPDEEVYQKELETTAKMFKNFRFFPFVSTTQGRLTIEKIKENSGELKGKDILICGPQPMVRAIRAQLIAAGVESEYIHEEEYGFR